MTAEMTVPEVLDRAIDWAEQSDDVRALAILGSHARRDATADEWSDLDLLVVVLDPVAFVADTEWLSHLGNPVLTFIEQDEEAGRVERRVLLEDGLDIDVNPLSREAAQLFISGEMPPEVADVLRRGIRFVVDKDGLQAGYARLLERLPEPGPPSQEEFTETVRDFWYHALWTVKKLRRGELWVAHACCDSYMKRLLLRMIEWREQAVHGWDYDTWYRGRFLERWADPRIVEVLRSGFARYDPAEVARALHETVALFRSLTAEVAPRLGLDYPEQLDAAVTAMIEARWDTRAFASEHDGAAAPRA